MLGNLFVNTSSTRSLYLILPKTQFQMDQEPQLRADTMKTLPFNREAQVEIFN